MSRPRLAATVVAAALAGAPALARAGVPVQRTFDRLASSNGFGAVMVDLTQARATHFREHLFATEEPLLDASGNEIWNGSGFATIPARDLLYDAYFGLRTNGKQAWLTNAPVDLDASGWVPWQANRTGGTGIARMVQHAGGLDLEQVFYAPWGLAHASFVMAMHVTNAGAATVTGVSAFSLHNLHLGFGRPGVMSDIGEQGETITFDAGGGHADFLERAFAGVVVARALGAPSHHAAWTAATPSDQTGYGIVAAGGTVDLPDVSGEQPAGDGSVSAFQWDLGDLAPGDERWVGVAFVHHGDPFGGAEAQAWLDAWAGMSPEALDVVTEEIAGWSTFQAGITPPTGLSADEETVARHAAVLLRMAQVRESSAYLREWLTTDGEPRRTRFGTTLGGPPAGLPATVQHRGKGAVIASLPPGEWTIPWVRDGSYAAVAMAALGMKQEARDALSFYLNAEGGRFQGWKELAGYGMPPYVLSLVRYQGFGVEEADFNDFGPNLEFDGFGLYLWALAAYERLTGDTTFADEAWPVVSGKIADALVALVDPETGLVRKDSSIWETHWNGRERAWTYTSLAAARGLCDAAAIAERRGDAKAGDYRAAGESIRAAIASKLVDANGALASNAEELAAYDGYFDAAVIDAIAMGLFDPKGRTATATLAALDAHLLAPAGGVGWSRNDDRFDHSGSSDLSPWGSPYDSAEWVVTDMRGAVAFRRGGDAARADALLGWVGEQTRVNDLAPSETYDEGNGTYEFNAPMIGFGAGVIALALAERGGPLEGPACGAFFVEGEGGAGGGSSSGAGGAATGGASASSDGGGCGCRQAGGDAPGGAPGAIAGLVLAGAVRRRSRVRCLP